MELNPTQPGDDDRGPTEEVAAPPQSDPGDSPPVVYLYRSEITTYVYENLPSRRKRTGHILSEEEAVVLARITTFTYDINWRLKRGEEPPGADAPS